MQSFEVGQRVELVQTGDVHTRLRPGDRGTVVAPFDRFGGLDVAWDSGSRLSMLPDEGDVVKKVGS